MNAIEISHLTKSFGELKAVDDLSLSIPKGEIFGLLGPNGAGKTTLIHSIIGVYRIDAGTIHVLGHPIPEEKLEARKKIGFMPQDLAIYSDLTPKDNFLFYGRLYGMPDQTIKQRMKELLAMLRLEEKKNTVVHKLSGGQKRRVSLGISLLTEPELLILDEPTVGVDPVLRKEFWDYFQRLKEEGKTILITTHITDEAMRADRVGMMIKGKIIATGNPNELMRQNQASTLEDLFIRYEKGGINE